MAINDKGINMHKRLAMGDTVKGYAKGGKVGVNPTPVVTGRMVPQSIGLPMNPLEVAKRNNGVPGMKKGGKCK